VRLTLVQPPNGYLDPYDLAPPLGLLTLAAVVRDDGVDVALVDFNLGARQHPDRFGEIFYDWAVDEIADTEPDVVGFTSMVVESHVCLELARRLKERDPAVVVVLGGPHFSAIARPALELYPWVDYVVTGEGELALVGLLRRLRGVPVEDELVNVAARRNGTVELRRSLRTLGSLDALPFPAYDLVRLDDYFAHNPVRLLNFDGGRGCIFRCSFCYSPGHWGQGEQVMSADRVVEDVRRLADLGAGHLFFVQDNLVNSASATKRLCRELADAGAPVTWNAYATMQRLVPDLLDPLAEAGCTELFVGVDAISADAQLAFGKHFFKGWDSLRQRLLGCLDRGIVPTCAFMIDLPESGDHRRTDDALTTALLTRNLGCGIRLNTLTIYNDTATEQQLGAARRTYTELKPRLLLDTPPVIHANSYAREHPELFPFHSTPLDIPRYERFVTAMHAAYTLFTSYPRTLMHHVRNDGGSLWRLLDHVAERIGDLSAVDPRQRRPLEREVFQQEFGRFASSTLTEDAFALESAELAACLTPERVLEVDTGGTRRRFRAGGHRIVRLGHTPDRLSLTEPVEPVVSPAGGGRPERDESPGNYLVLRDGDELRYYVVDDAMVAPLRQLAQPSPGAPARALSPDAVAELVAVGLLQPMECAEEV